MLASSHVGRGVSLVESDQPMNRPVHVTIYWRNVSDGGKAQLPLNHPYYVITAPIEGPDGSRAAWSVVLEVTKNHQSRDIRIGTGTARFLAPNAPRDLLCPGSTLEVYEGRRAVARLEFDARGTPT